VTSDRWHVTCDKLFAIQLDGTQSSATLGALRVSERACFDVVRPHRVFPRFFWMSLFHH